jgi:hypothetical protein
MKKCFNLSTVQYVQFKFGCENIIQYEYCTYCTHLYVFSRLRSPCREDLQTVKENGTGRETEIR